MTLHGDRTDIGFFNTYYIHTYIVINCFICMQYWVYSVHRSNPNPPPPPSGPPIAAVYSQIGQNRPQKSAVPTRNMDYYGPASGAIPPPLPPVALTTVIKDNTSPRSNNQVGNAPPVHSSSTFISDPNLPFKVCPAPACEAVSPCPPTAPSH